MNLEDIHSTDWEAQALKAGIAELIKAKFQFQTIKKRHDLYIYIYISQCFQLMKLIGQITFAGSHIVWACQAFFEAKLGLTCKKLM